MPKGIAIVEHRVSDNPLYCEYSAPDDGFCEYSVCGYLRMELKTGKRGTMPVRMPRCSLFKAWLERDYHTKRCVKCKMACGEEV